jgi:uncharacterized Zn finger protein
MSWYAFKPYVSVAQRQAKAAREVAKMSKKGKTISPIKLEGRTIAATFWGKAWCDNLESYSDYENRLPRGRSYVRNGSVVDLQIQPGKVTALVSGSELYTVTVKIETLESACWKSLKAKCAGQIGSLVELLQGKLSKSVMELVTERETGLFPKPKEISIKCSCPDWAGLCKHSAAVLYGVGARLDRKPELFFQLRKVDHLELVEAAVAAPVTKDRGRSDKRMIATSDLADVFGIELVEPTNSDEPSDVAQSSVKKSRRKKAETTDVKLAQGPRRKTKDVAKAVANVKQVRRIDSNKSVKPAAKKRKVAKARG